MKKFSLDEDGNDEDEDGNDEDEDGNDDELGEDCPASHQCYPASAPSVWGRCIAGAKGHADPHLCSHCGSFF